MSPTCRRHVANTRKCRQICPKLHVGSDTTHEKRVPDTANLCVVSPTLTKSTNKITYKITTSCLRLTHDLRDNNMLLHSNNSRPNLCYRNLHMSPAQTSRDHDHSLIGGWFVGWSVGKSVEVGLILSFLFDYVPSFHPLLLFASSSFTADRLTID